MCWRTESFFFLPHWNWCPNPRSCTVYSQVRINTQLMITMVSADWREQKHKIIRNRKVTESSILSWFHAFYMFFISLNCLSCTIEFLLNKWRVDGWMWGIIFFPSLIRLNWIVDLWWWLMWLLLNSSHSERSVSCGYECLSASCLQTPASLTDSVWRAKRHAATLFTLVQSIHGVMLKQGRTHLAAPVNSYKYGGLQDLVHTYKTC